MSDLGNKDVLAKNLQYYMNINNKTRNDICDDLGFKYSTFSDWINAKKYPRIDKIEIMANYFNITKADLIESKVTTETKTKDGDIERIERAREKMDDDDKEAMMKVLEAAFAKYFND